MMGGYGMTGGFGFDWIFMILWAMLIIVGIVVLVKWMSTPAAADGRSGESRALNILKERYPEQAEKIDPLQAELTRRNLDLMQQRREAQARLNQLYASEKRDWDAIRAAAGTMFDLQRQQMEAAIDTQQKIDSVLNDSQRRQMAHAWRSHEWMWRHNRQRAMP